MVFHTVKEYLMFTKKLSIKEDLNKASTQVVVFSQETNKINMKVNFKMICSMEKGLL